ncbi:biotin--[acetyl-CoA-carboxylase] ligase [Thermosulfurimonas sp.]|uniref:biotin--[acetyl-CoA-carboxylase] ligase n=1 Tax=Thermosulfurimonas sp. TaxID=2080236 RepID=UPI0025F9B852|nr:biotin--[acetyl-CoA-carboxylase] ligase [Thermosulfurimonas sp.]
MAGAIDPRRRAEELGREIRVFRSVERLMPLAYELACREPRTAHGRLFRAERLSAARGRHGRLWVAETGGLWLALTLYDDLLPATRGLFSLVFGIALGALAAKLDLPARVRWINDLHHQGRKIAGVLIQKRGEWLVVGIGINVNNPPPSAFPAESLSRLNGGPLSLDEVLERFLDHLRHYYGWLREIESRLHPYDSPEENLLIREFRRFSDTPGRCVAWAPDLDHTPEPFIGLAERILPDGSLLLRGAETRVVSSGEIIYLF